MRYLITLLICSVCFADSTLVIVESYPSNGANLIDVDSTVWFTVTVETDSDLIAPSLTNGGSADIWLLNVMGKQDTISELVADGSDDWTVTLTNLDSARDCVRVARVGDWPYYFKIWIKVYGQPHTEAGADSFYFITESTSTPFGVYPTSMFGRDTTSTGSRSIAIVRPLGSTCYMMTPDETVSEIIEPDVDYADEIKRKRVNYTVSGLSQWPERYYFWVTGTDGTTSDTVGVMLDYKQTKYGRPIGGVGR